MTSLLDDTAPSAPKERRGLDALLDLLGEDLNAVNQLIVDNMQSQVALIPQLAGHIVAAGGKRLRPLLTLATARLCGNRSRRHLGLAACVEFIHTATLLHDDVVDDSDLRRGRSTARAIWGNEASVLVGDFLFSRAFQIMVADGSLPVLKLLSDTSARIAEGEVLQLMTANDLETDAAAYFRVIEAKTAVLFAAACEVGAMVADRPRAEADALRSYGMELGLAFQLVDDILDYAEDAPALGKTVGDDFREGKVTLPVILAFAAGDGEEQAFWRRCLEEGRQTDGDLTRAQALLREHGALDAAKSVAREHSERAVASLRAFPDSPIKRALVETAHFTVDRLF